MNSVSSSYHSSEYTPPSHYANDPELRHVLSSTFHVLEQPPPPTLREILAAYRSKGDGDRDMLLAMLNAKAAEDQRLASYASLRRSALEVYQASANNQASSPLPPPPRLNGAQSYPTPGFSHSPQLEDRRSYRHRHRDASRSRSPQRRQPYLSHRDSHLSHEPLRKRQRPSPPPSSARHAPYDIPSVPQPELPPSPYSSARSESAEYSPRSRTSMAIGSLLSSGPTKDPKVDDS